jgi:2,3-bisphosphoglycerate-independent phosphoglycerate mutase
VLDAGIRAVESVDRGIGAIAQAVLAQRGALLITADHGNCEMMIDPITHQPHTAHTLNPVPLIFVQAGELADDLVLAPRGRICDVAPTMLQLLGIPQPAAMTGHSLLPDRFPNRAGARPGP